MQWAWLVGAVVLISVIPITLVLIKPINDILLSGEIELDSQETGLLLHRWGPKHWLRTIVSVLTAFLVMSHFAAGKLSTWYMLLVLSLFSLACLTLIVQFNFQRNDMENLYSYILELQATEGARTTLSSG